MMVIMREMTESMVPMYDTQVRAVAFGSVDGGSGLTSCRRERSTYTMNSGGRPIVMYTRINFPDTNVDDREQVYIITALNRKTMHKKVCSVLIDYAVILLVTTVIPYSKTV